MRLPCHISERGLTSATWSEYSENAVKRVQYSSDPTSTITVPPQKAGDMYRQLRRSKAA